MYSVLPWSYSSLQAFETCPRRFKLTRITRQAKETQSAELAEGNRVHKAMELAVRDGIPVPANYARLQPIADRVRLAPGHKHVEYEFALTQQLTPTRWRAPDAWVRGKIDVAVVRETDGLLIDWKNGKRKLDMDQLKLFAAAGFSLFPHVVDIVTAYAWLQVEKLDREKFNRDEATPIWQEFAIRVHRMEEALRKDDFPAKPSGLCRKWCPVGRALCEHCGE